MHSLSFHTIAFIAMTVGCAGSSPAQTNVCPDRTAHVQFASIHETRSSNSPEVFVTLNCDGSAERTLGAAGTNNIKTVSAQSFPTGSPSVLAVLADVNAVGNVATLAAQPSCAKSVSFGTATTIAVGGVTSVDLQCLANPTADATDLLRDCAVLAPTTN